MTAEQNFRLLQEIDANRRMILMAYLQNPKLHRKAGVQLDKIEPDSREKMEAEPGIEPR